MSAAGQTDARAERGRAAAPAAREARTLRRALLAGAVVWLAAGGALGVALAPAGGDASALGVLLGLALALVVASGWLLLAALLDLLAGQPVGRLRTAVTALLVLATVVVPLLIAAAGG